MFTSLSGARPFAILASTLFIIHNVLAAPTDIFQRPSQANISYTLAKNYSGPTFFDDWNFISTADPAHGFVTYVDKNTAQSDGLVSFDGNFSVIKVDSTTKITNMNAGRNAVRIESTFNFTHALIITEIAQIPSNICGTWPAFWTLGAAAWPTDGELDIIEGANLQTGNWMSLHTAGASNISNDTASFSAKVAYTDCETYLDGPTPNYTGCRFEDQDPKTYANYTGGVWATQWTAESVLIWYWPYGSVPADVTAGAPCPGDDGWGVPHASFAPPNNVRIEDNLRNHHVIFNTDFCGDLGNAVWNSSGCASSTGYSSCQDYVANVPSAFAEANWRVKYLNIYTETS